MSEAEDVLASWFLPGLDADQAAHARQFQFWFGGGANEQIVQRFADIHAAATQGALDAWADTRRGRQVRRTQDYGFSTLPSSLPVLSAGLLSGIHPTHGNRGPPGSH